MHVNVPVSDLFRQKIELPTKSSILSQVWSVEAAPIPFNLEAVFGFLGISKLKLVSLVHQAGLSEARQRPTGSQNAGRFLGHSGKVWSTRHAFILVLVVLDQLDRLLSRLYTPRTFTKTSQKRLAQFLELRVFLLEMHTFPLRALFWLKLRYRFSLRDPFSSFSN